MQPVGRGLPRLRWRPTPHPTYHTAPPASPSGPRKRARAFEPENGPLDRFHPANGGSVLTHDEYRHSRGCPTNPCFTAPVGRASDRLLLRTTTNWRSEARPTPRPKPRPTISPDHHPHRGAMTNTANPLDPRPTRASRD